MAPSMDFYHMGRRGGSPSSPYKLRYPGWALPFKSRLKNMFPEPCVRRHPCFRHRIRQRLVLCLHLASVSSFACTSLTTAHMLTTYCRASNAGHQIKGIDWKGSSSHMMVSFTMVTFVFVYDFRCFKNTQGWAHQWLTQSLGGWRRTLWGRICQAHR